MNTICLNMIVKNEAHIIYDTFEQLLKKIKIDYYVICDTGSSDETPKVIQTFFEQKGIQGELHFHEWKNFGHNRSLALECSRNKCDYTLIFDADDSIEGNFILPFLDKDYYMLKFGNTSFSYQRSSLVKSSLTWKYLGVLHEFLTCDETTTQGIIEGDYFVISGRTSARNKNPNKYLDDAKVLEAGYNESLQTNDGLHNRYAYYCANSYNDAGKPEEAIKWYKLTLTLQGWFDERYNSCLKLYELLPDESKYYYLVESYKHNPRRVECILQLIVHYVYQKQYHIAVNYYNLIKNYYENEYPTDDLSQKLFSKIPDYSFFLPYYMVIALNYTGDFETGFKMFDVIFEKKYYPGEWWINNVLFNSRFYVPHLKDTTFFDKLEKYVQFLETNKLSFNKQFYLDVKPPVTTTGPSILFYTGFSDVPWNKSYSETHALGGSERAVIYLSQQLAKWYTVYIAGDVCEEQIDGLHFISRSRLYNLMKTETFKVIIVSRYVSFFNLYKSYNCEKLILMSHDTELLNNLTGCTISPNEILQNNKIDACVCLTNWHKETIRKNYPTLSCPFKIINNGINPRLFHIPIKKPNSFVYTSCSARGLERLLQLWPQITELFPDATLNISSYQTFPSTHKDNSMELTIQQFQNITHHGKLNQSELYRLMEQSEYWLYPCSFDETSCITSMEMLMAEVICLYYPRAGLTETMNGHGVQITHGTELQTLRNLTQKMELRKAGKLYAQTCSWEQRANKWKRFFDEPIYKVDYSNRQAFFTINPECYICQHYIQQNKIWEPYLHTTFEKYITPESIVVEGGGHVGVHTIKLGMLAKKVYVFEPLPQSNGILRQNVELNGLSNVEVFVEGLSDTISTTRYKWIPGNNPGGSGLDNNPLGTPDWVTVTDKSVPVNLVTIDSLNLEKLDFIKLDIEGYEENAIRGGMETIRRCKPVIVLECYNDNVNKNKPLTKQEVEEKYKALIDIGYIVEHLEHADYILRFKRMIFYRSAEFNENVLKDYARALGVVLTTDLTGMEFDEIVFVHEVHDLYVFQSNKIISYLNTEPLNLAARLYNVIHTKHPAIKTIYDYSLANIRILNKNGIHNTVHLEYPYNSSEVEFLKSVRCKMYDFGILCSGRDPTYDIEQFSPPRRKDVVKYLLSQGFSVNIIHGWGEDRDREIAKCKQLLNIHGQYFEQPTTIFEHIRCNRLLYAGYNILSEISEDLDPEFINKYPNLQFIKYSDFFTLQRKPKIIDCFTFYNELTLLEYRLKILYPVVDYFVLVEATRTHVGKPKKLYFDRSRFEKYLDKIVHIVVDDFPFDDTTIDISKEHQWVNEKFQRDCITRGLSQLHLQPQDIITVCDLDEIPDPETLTNACDFTICSLEQDFYYYNLNSKMDHNWYHAKIMKYGSIKYKLSDIRMSPYPVMKRGGWHLSYFGTPEFISNKIQNFGHQEYNSEKYTNVESIRSRIIRRVDMYDRPIQITFVSLEENGYLPPNCTELQNNEQTSLLDELSLKYRLDKNVKILHDYIPVYEQFLKERRFSIQRVLEIGIGSTENGQMSHILHTGYKTGNSLRCWRDYFPNATIHGVDIYPCDINEPRIQTSVVDQSNEQQLQALEGPFDLIIDDGSRVYEHQILSFNVLESKLSTGGMYVIEDINENYKHLFKENMFYNVHLFDNKPGDTICVFTKKENFVTVCPKPFMGNGNVMFQIAEAAHYCETYNYKLAINKHSSFFPHIPVRCSTDDQVVYNDYTSQKVVPSKNIAIHGYSQNVELFREHFHTLKKYFNFTDTSKFDYLRNKYLSKEKCNVMIGFRLNTDGGFKYKTLSMKSYESVMERFENANFFVLSDIDPSNFLLNSKYNVTWIQECDIDQFYFGLLCDHFILSESTFHYWIALLKQSPESKVYVFNDTDITNRNLHLDTWIVVDKIPDDFLFIQGYDQNLCDQKCCIGSVNVLREITIKENCVAFNTFGYIKNKTKHLTPLINCHENDGVYVRSVTKNVCFIHSCTTNGTQRLDHLLELLPFELFDLVFINNIGKEISGYPKVILTNCSENINLYETPTIHKLWKFSKDNHGYNVLYLHTKGSTNNTQSVNDWVTMMLYFVLDPKNPKLLERYDTLGCNLLENNRHYSGNFWWATTNYISTLPECGNYKNDAEFWLLQNKNSKSLCLHNSNVDHYYQPYPPTKYDFISNIFSTWTGHRVFAEWLVHYLKPSTVVDLGVDFGYSSFVFANANVYGKVYGVDLFKGDPHAGERDTYPLVMNTIKKHSIQNLEIIQGDFTDVSKTWNRPIDILHIDGYHTYEAIKNDFTNWSKFVSENGVVLFHDTAIEKFGILSFFNELSGGYKLNFTHSAGLGIFTKNEKLYRAIVDRFENVYTFVSIKPVKQMKILIVFRAGYSRITDPETVINNIQKYILKPLSQHKVTVIFSTYNEDSSKLNVYKEKLRPEHVYIHQKNQDNNGQVINFKDQTLPLLENVDHDYVFFLRFEMIYKLNVFDWGIFNKEGMFFPYKEDNEDLFTKHNWYSDTIIIVSKKYFDIFRKTIMSTPLDDFIPLYTLHNIANLVKDVPVHCIIDGYYNSNTLHQDNPLCILYNRPHRCECIERYTK